jgi:hypothetical protein
MIYIELRLHASPESVLLLYIVGWSPVDSNSVLISLVFM